jgi:uridine phosphorylase
MNFPNFANKYGSRSLLNAEDIVGYRRRLGRHPHVPDLQGVLLCLERGLPRRLRWQIPVQEVGNMNGVLYGVKKTKNRVAVMTNFGGGSPMVAELAEEYAVMGAKRLVLMTWGGALQPDLKAGDIVVCDRAIRDDGASHHYLPAEKYISANRQLVDNLASAIRGRGAQCSTGSTWTTDAPYRETLEEVQQYQSEGVKTVEMESAGLFTVGQVRGIATASVVVVMDSLATYRWQVPERLDAIQHSLEVVYSAAIEVLAAPI